MKVALAAAVTLCIVGAEWAQECKSIQNGKGGKEGSKRIRVASRPGPRN